MNDEEEEAYSVVAFSGFEYVVGAVSMVIAFVCALLFGSMTGELRDVVGAIGLVGGSFATFLLVVCPLTAFLFGQSEDEG